MNDNPAAQRDLALRLGANHSKTQSLQALKYFDRGGGGFCLAACILGNELVDSFFFRGDINAAAERGPNILDGWLDANLVRIVDTVAKLRFFSRMDCSGIGIEPHYGKATFAICFRYCPILSSFSFLYTLN
jgi:hypothetical protein